MTHIDELPTEILLHILSFLSLKELFVVENVSLRWQDAFNFCLGHVRDFRVEWPHDITDKDLQRLLPRMRSLQAVNIDTYLRETYMTNRPKLDLHIIAHHCRQLVEIDLRPFQVDVSSLQSLCLFSPRLEIVTMNRWCPDSCLEALLRHQRHLRELIICEPTGSGQYLHMLPPTLERLTLTDWERQRIIFYTEPADIVSHVSKCVELRQLELEFVSIFRSSALGVVLARCTKLERLSIRGSTIYERHGLRQLTVCAWLKELDVSDLGWLQAADLSAGLAGCVRLERLSAARLKAPLEECLPPTGLPALRHLHVRGATGVTDQSLRRLPGLLPGLKTLNISFCKAVTEEGLNWLLQFTELRALNLVGVPCVSDSVLNTLCRGQLTDLELGCADTFTELVSSQAVIRLVLECCSMELLTLYDKLSRVRHVVDGLSCQLPPYRDVTLVLYPRFPSRLPLLQPGPLHLTDTTSGARTW